MTKRTGNYGRTWIEAVDLPALPASLRKSQDAERLHEQLLGLVAALIERALLDARKDTEARAWLLEDAPALWAVATGGDGWRFQRCAVAALTTRRPPARKRLREVA